MPFDPLEVFNVYNKVTQEEMKEAELMKGFQTLGCKDNLKCAMATMVCVDLEEAYKLNNLEKLYSEELDIIYFRGQREGCESEIIVPLSCCKDADMLEFEKIQRKLGGDLKTVTMAVCEPNSNVLYYSFVNGFREK